MKRLAKVKDTGNIKKNILEAVNMIGGFEKFIKKGETILIKPNFNTADPFPASTDFEFLKNVVELIYERCEPKIVMVGESSTMSLNTRKIMEELGVFRLEEENFPARIYFFEERNWIKKEIPGSKFLKSVYITEFIDRADKIILLPCLKTHSYAQYTGALKLSLGFVKPFQRIKFHLSHLQEKIAELNKIISPTLLIMDARKCFVSGGPAKGKVKEPGLILASTSRVAMDIEGIKIIRSFWGNSLKGVNPKELPQIKRAIEMGIS